MVSAQEKKMIDHKKHPYLPYVVILMSLVLTNNGQKNMYADYNVRLRAVFKQPSSSVATSHLPTGKDQ